MTSRCILLIFLFMQLLSSNLFSADGLLTPSAYGQQLDAVLHELEQNNYSEVEKQLTALHDRRVAWAAGTYPSDTTLKMLALEKKYGELRTRLVAIREFTTSYAETESKSSSKVDRLSLAHIQDREALAGSKLKRGGTTFDNPLTTPPLPDSITERLAISIEWFGDKVVDFFKWLRDFFFPPKEKSADGQTSTLLTWVWIMVGVIVVVIIMLAWFAWSKKDPGVKVTPLTSAAPVQKDADPRSRVADEWVQYATELFRAGRHREAIRAWYHAMLMSCWSYGILHHRVGRTNWEYAMSLSGAVAWRSRFQDLTHRFDLAWYGGRIGVDEAHAYAIEAEQLLRELQATGRGS